MQAIAALAGLVRVVTCWVVDGRLTLLARGSHVARPVPGSGPAPGIVESDELAAAIARDSGTLRRGSERTAQRFAVHRGELVLIRQ